MDFSLTDDQRLLREQIVDFARRELNAGAAARDRSGEFPRELWKRCGEMSLPGLPVPEEHGGLGLDPTSMTAALEAFGYGCRDGGLVFAVGAHLLSCVVPIWKYGTEEQKARYLPGLCHGDLIAVNGMTEPGSGSDAFAMQTRAVSDGDGFRLSGRKVFASNGPVADVAVVYAMTDPDKGAHGGVTCFVIDRDTPGFDAGQTFDKMGLRSCPLGELVLEDVKVPASAVVGGVGGGATVFGDSMQWERIGLSACHVGHMEHLHERCIEYARTRSASGQRIGKFQAVSNRLADMKIRLETGRMLTYRAASRLDAHRDVALWASMAKLHVSESLVTAALDTVRTFGGYGYMTEYEVERSLRDAVGGTLYSGTSDVQRNIIARWLGL